MNIEIDEILARLEKLNKPELVRYWKVVLYSDGSGFIESPWDREGLDRFDNRFGNLQECVRKLNELGARNPKGNCA